LQQRSGNSKFFCRLSCTHRQTRSRRVQLGRSRNFWLYLRCALYPERCAARSICHVSDRSFHRSFMGDLNWCVSLQISRYAWFIEVASFARHHVPAETQVMIVWSFIMSFTERRYRIRVSNIVFSYLSRETIYHVRSFPGCLLAKHEISVFL
jgi:hypothetical protein